MTSGNAVSFIVAPPDIISAISLSKPPLNIPKLIPAPKAKSIMDEAQQYVVYRFGPGEKVNLDDPTHILCITKDTMLPLTYEGGKTKYTYVVTALDRLQNESKAVKKKVKL